MRLTREFITGIGGSIGLILDATLKTRQKEKKCKGDEEGTRRPFRENRKRKSGDGGKPNKTPKENDDTVLTMGSHYLGL